MTREQLVEILEYVEGTWRRPIGDLTAKTWWMELGNLDAELVGAAVRAVALSDREHPPTAGHVLAEIAEQSEGAPSFGEAWQQVLAAIRHHGSHRPQTIVDSLSHPAVAELAAQLDIRELGLAPESSLTTWHAQTRERYAAILRKRRRAITHAELPPAIPRDQLRGEGRGPKQIGASIGDLVEGLTPESPEAAA